VSAGSGHGGPFWLMWVVKSELRSGGMRPSSLGVTPGELSDETRDTSYFDLKKSVAGEAVGFVGDSTPSRSG
jgi:hypothetical protein